MSRTKSGTHQEWHASSTGIMRTVKVNRAELSIGGSSKGLEIKYRDGETVRGDDGVEYVIENGELVEVLKGTNWLRAAVLATVVVVILTVVAAPGGDWITWIGPVALGFTIVATVSMISVIHGQAFNGSEDSHRGDGGRSDQGMSHEDHNRLWLDE